MDVLKPDFGIHRWCFGKGLVIRNLGFEQDKKVQKPNRGEQISPNLITNHDSLNKTGDIPDPKLRFERRLNQDNRLLRARLFGMGVSASLLISPSDLFDQAVLGEFLDISVLIWPFSNCLFSHFFCLSGAC